MGSLVLVGTVAAAIIFAVVWYVCVRIRNYGFLDVTWTLSVGLLALIDGVTATGNPMRRALFTAVAVAWSLRLGVFVLLRVVREHPREDKRYVTLRQRWPSPLAFLVFFELQALIAVIFSVPFLLADVDPNPHIGPLEWIGLAVAAVGIVGESVADAQASAFKRQASGARRVLDVGLWRYSRHPNYFFEAVVWIGVALAALGLPHGWLAIAAPLLILYFLLRVTGIPLTEKHSLETHGQAYRDYQQRTSAFIPWQPKSIIRG
jgi:steroid 5-alpha reductase family enzyme